MTEGYRFRSYYLHLNGKVSFQHGLEIIKIDLLISEIRSSSVMNQDFELFSDDCSLCFWGKNKRYGAKSVKKA